MSKLLICLVTEVLMVSCAGTITLHVTGLNIDTLHETNETITTNIINNLYIYITL